MTKETIKEQAELFGINVVSKSNIYNFKVGKMIIDIEDKTEQKAMIKLINEYWEYIDKYGKIKLYGLAQKVKDS